MTESEAKNKAMEVLKPVEMRLYEDEWRSLLVAIQDELLKAFENGLTEGAIIGGMMASEKGVDKQK